MVFFTVLSDYSFQDHGDPWHNVRDTRARSDQMTDREAGARVAHGERGGTSGVLA